MAKLHDYYRDTVVNELKSKIQLLICHASPTNRKDYPEYGCG